MGNRNIVFDDNDQDYPVSPNKITILERFHSDHPNPDSKTYKLLGIYLDEHLSLNYHINVLSKKLAKANYILNKVKNILPRNALKTLYFSLFHCHLTYCPTIIACANASTLNRIVKKLFVQPPYLATEPILNHYLRKLMPFPT